MPPQFQIEANGVVIATCRAIRGLELVPGGTGGLASGRPGQIQGVGRAFSGSYHVATVTHRHPGGGATATLLGVRPTHAFGAQQLQVWRLSGVGGKRKIRILPMPGNKGWLELTDAWVKKLDGPDLNGKGNDVEMEEIELGFESVGRPGQDPD